MEREEFKILVKAMKEDKFRYFKVRRDIEWFYDKLFPKE